MIASISPFLAGRRRYSLLLAILLFTSGGVVRILCAQSNTAESERFEVASIRPSATTGLRPVMDFTPAGGVHATNVTLKMLIQMTYDIRSDQLSGGPGWTDSVEYTVIAKAPEDGPVVSEAEKLRLVQKRLEALLRERFHLSLKIETTPTFGYILTAEARGHKMTTANDTDARQLRQVGRWEIQAEGVEMSSLARFLSVHLQGTVVDRTGLEGRYTFHLKWNPMLSNGESIDSIEVADRAIRALLAALPGQLGLRLDSQKLTTDRYTIERVERPAEN